MSSLKCFPCRVCLLVISLMYHYSMERSTFIVTMCPFIFSRLQPSLDNINAYKHPWWAHCSFLPRCRGIEVMGMKRTLQWEKIIFASTYKMPHLPLHHQRANVSRRIPSFRKPILILSGACFSSLFANQHPLLQVTTIYFSVVCSHYLFLLIIPYILFHFRC